MLILWMQSSVTREGANNLFTVHTYNISVKNDFGMYTCSSVYAAASEVAFMNE